MGKAIQPIPNSCYYTCRYLDFVQLRYAQLHSARYAMMGGGFTRAIRRATTMIGSANPVPESVLS